MEKIRLGIVGLGWMGSYLAQLTTMPDVELTAAADIDEKGLREITSYYRIKEAFGRIPKNPWIGKREVSGGMINENGVHVLYMFRWIGGNVKKAYARTATFTSGVNIEDSAVAVLEHENNAISTLIQCWHCTHSWRRWGMVFEGGTLTIDGYLGGTCKISLRNARVTKTCTYPNSIDEMYRSELRHFINCIKEGKKPLTNEEDRLYAQVLVEAIYASANDGIPKDINSLLSKVL